MSSPGNFNLSIYQGQTFNLTFIWSTTNCCGPNPPVGATTGPVDLTGYTATLQICQYAGGNLLYDASADLTLGGVNGTIDLSIPSSATEGFNWWNAVYDLMVADSSGNVTSLLTGKVKVTPSVSTPP